MGFRKDSRKENLRLKKGKGKGFRHLLILGGKKGKGKGFHTKSRKN